ncbi:MAG: hypothetical protein VYC55_07915 [Pseudomonadota bacterium]|nr:hypothetical protein [Pseudomonadota bacterium]
MIDVEWNDNAKAAVRNFADYVGQSNKCYRYFNHVVKNQTKTVADAVEYYNGVWPEDEPYDFVCVWNNKGERFEFWCEGYAPVGYCHQVCTREQFEAYVKEQEGEKWTHTTPLGDKCYIKDNEQDCEGVVLVVVKNLGYDLMKPEQLKTIKPTISESDAKALEVFANKSHRHGVAWAVKEYLNGHDII